MRGAVHGAVRVCCVSKISSAPLQKTLLPCSAARQVLGAVHAAKAVCLVSQSQLVSWLGCLPLRCSWEPAVLPARRDRPLC